MTDPVTDARAIGRPRVTVAIPLHASLRFVDIVSANISRLPATGIEIIVSDRTRRDDAIEVLKGRHGDDRRITWICTSEGLSWIEHYNDLLRRANGRYMCWMPHDDDFPEGHVDRLADALDADPSALIACGPVRRLEWDPAAQSHALIGEGIDKMSPPPPIQLGELPRGREALALARRWHVTIPFRGLFRREFIVLRNMFLRNVGGNYMTDVMWCVMVIALGPMIYLPDAWCAKRFYPDSTHRSWPAPSLRQIALIVPTCLSMVIAARLPLRDAIPVLVYSGRISVWSLRRKLPGRSTRVRSKTQTA